MWPTPASEDSRGFARVTSTPCNSMWPPCGTRMPARAWISSLCPLPSTPAMPTISPARTVIESPRTASSPRSSRTHRSRTDSTVSPGCAAPRATSSSTSRPTISSARLRSLAPSRSIVATFAPRRSTEMRSATSSTSCSLCVIRMIDVPPATSARSTEKSSSTSCGVSTAVGSSRIRTRAWRYSALRISTRCCWPTPISSMTASGSTARP